MTRQQARAAARQMSKLWVSERIRGPRKERKLLASDIAKAHWNKLRENPPNVGQR